MWASSTSTWPTRKKLSVCLAGLFLLAITILLAIWQSFCSLIAWFACLFFFFFLLCHFPPLFLCVLIFMHDRAGGIITTTHTHTICRRTFSGDRGGGGGDEVGNNFSPFTKLSLSLSSSERWKMRWKKDDKRRKNEPDELLPPFFAGRGIHTHTHTQALQTLRTIKAVQHR